MVGVGGLGAVAASALNRDWFAKDGRGQGSWWNRQNGSLDRAGLNEWSRHVGSVFELQTESGAAGFKLLAITPLVDRGQRPAELGRDRAFLATFEGNAQTAGNRTYTARHAAGTLDIFFGPISQSGQSATLSAVFN
jgi:hypothetical protein